MEKKSTHDTTQRVSWVNHTNVSPLMTFLACDVIAGSQIFHDPEDGTKIFACNIGGREWKQSHARVVCCLLPSGNSPLGRQTSIIVHGVISFSVKKNREVSSIFDDYYEKFDKDLDYGSIFIPEDTLWRTNGQVISQSNVSTKHSMYRLYHTFINASLKSQIEELLNTVQYDEENSYVLNTYSDRYDNNGRFLLSAKAIVDWLFHKPHIDTEILVGDIILYGCESNDGDWIPFDSNDDNTEHRRISSWKQIYLLRPIWKKHPHEWRRTLMRLDRMWYRLRPVVWRLCKIIRFLRHLHKEITVTTEGFRHYKKRVRELTSTIAALHKRLKEDHKRGCVICFEPFVDGVAYTYRICGHRCMCESCYKTSTREQLGVCPVCRKKQWLSPMKTFSD